MFLEHFLCGWETFSIYNYFILEGQVWWVFCQRMLTLTVTHIIVSTFNSVNNYKSCINSCAELYFNSVVDFIIGINIVTTALIVQYILTIWY